MADPWRRSGWFAAARVAVALMLLGALLIQQSDRAPEGVHAVVLIQPAAGISSQDVRDRLLGEIGAAASVSVDLAAVEIDTAIENALWSIDPSLQGAIIVASGGHWNPELKRTLLRASAAGVPVFWLPLLPAEVIPEIVSVVAPDRARPGQRIGVAVEVRVAEAADLILLGDNRPLIRKTVLQSGTVDFEAVVPATGPFILGAEIRSLDEGEAIARNEQGALVNVATATAIMVASDHPSLFAASLRSGGWSVTELSTRELSGRIADLQSFDGLVLDDVAISDLPAAAWSEIADAVRRDALGLLVLGGPNSFGLGAYRGSQLESLLPVIAEPPADEAPASLMFLIDVSGSMDAAGATNRRLQLARQAVLETVDALRPVDRVGLITFDVAARELLPLASRDDHVASIEQVWPGRASGGTQLMPSLRLAIDALQRQDGQQKLLVLLTDGLLASEDTDRLGDFLRGTDIELVGMIIDDGNQSVPVPLARIAQANGGRIIRIDDVLHLPTLMRAEIESRRPAVVTAPSLPRVTLPAKMLPGDVSWPVVGAYSLTRPRAAAHVHLRSTRGDVLVASMNAGAGRVVAMTSGLSGWNAAWLQWNEWPNVATALTNFISARSTNRFEVSLQQQSTGMTTLNVELADRTLRDENLTATVVSPSGKVSSIELQLESPGQFAAELPLAGVGQYALTIDDGSATARQRFLNDPGGLPAATGPPIAKIWLDEKLLRPWHAGALGNLAARIDWRSWLIGFAALGFLLLLVLEHLDRDWKEWLTGLFRNLHRPGKNPR